VAWRAIAAPSGEIVIVHQGESETPIMTKTPGAYGASGPVVESEMTIVSSNGTTTTQTLSMTVLPVDVALSPDGTYGAVVSAGTAFTTLAQVSYFDFNSNLGRPPSAAPVLDNAQPIAVAFDGTGDVLVQSREPADLWVIPVIGTPTPISLSTASRDDTGHDVFHAQAGGLLACASCHPEGGDDGHLWLLDGAPRRTPSLRGTIAGTAPYHWPGDEANLVALADDVYSGRMSGAKLAADQTSALTAWVEAIPPPPAPSWVDAAAASRGRALFEGTAGCASCHSGPKYTNNATVFVGTGGKTLSTGGSDGILFQVPPLVGVGWRTPLLHDGCATTIADRFGKCATPKHGSTQQLSTQDVDDLSAYLESL
jgi:mono/diheme cytochrome c family protein